MTGFNANQTKSPRPKITGVIGAFAVFFGALTLYSGGSVALVDGPARQAAGNYVPLVVWFNFLAGIFYIIAGIGILLWRRWAAKLSMLIATATILVFVYLGVHVLQGGVYEMRTVAAMLLRCSLWVVIAVILTKMWMSGIPSINGEK